MARNAQRIGWYLLQGGKGPLFHGPIPEGAVEAPAPSAASSDEGIDAGDSIGELDTPALVDEQVAQSEQLVDGEVGIIDPLDEDSDVLGHEV